MAVCQVGAAYPDRGNRWNFLNAEESIKPCRLLERNSGFKILVCRGDICLPPPNTKRGTIRFPPIVPLLLSHAAIPLYLGSPSGPPFLRNALFQLREDQVGHFARRNGFSARRNISGTRTVFQHSPHCRLDGLRFLFEVKGIPQHHCA